MEHWYLGPLYGFIFTLITLVPLRKLAESRRMVDRPGGRKIHDTRVPLVGGVAMFLGVSWGVLATQGIDLEWSLFLLCAGVLVMTGLLDDVFDLKPSLRIAVYVTVGLVMTLGADQAVHSLGALFFAGLVTTGLLAVPFTILAMMAVINAWNMVDGVDGLAGAMALVALGAMTLLAWITGLLPERAYLAVIVAALVAFLVYNLPVGVNARLRTFMGDAGSMMLGFCITWFGIEMSQGDRAVASAVTFLWFAALPLHDLLFTFIHRVRRGRPLWAAGKDHVHHLCLEAGLSGRQTLGVLFLTSAVLAAIGLSGPLLGLSDGALFLGWIGAGALHFLLFRHVAVIRAIFGRVFSL